MKFYKEFYSLIIIPSRKNEIPDTYLKYRSNNTTIEIRCQDPKDNLIWEIFDAFPILLTIYPDIEKDSRVPKWFKDKNPEYYV
jgi:hypothetical protein